MSRIKSIDPGSLNKKITFLSLVESEDSMGQTVQAWQDEFTVWASVKSLRGGEYWEAKKLRPENTMKFTTRYRSGITEDMRIRYRGNIYEITKAENILEADEYLEIQAVEYVYKAGGE